MATDSALACKRYAVPVVLLEWPTSRVEKIAYGGFSFDSRTYLSSVRIRGAGMQHAWKIWQCMQRLVVKAEWKRTWNKAGSALQHLRIWR